RVIVDLVPNHTSDRHEWFQAAVAAPPGSPERARYVFRDGSGLRGSQPPNNWTSTFGGPAWTRLPSGDHGGGQWYLHLFAPEQPDLNWENPEVREAVYAMMRWWLARGVDGFRMDVVNFISKTPDLPDGAVRPGELHGDGTPYFFSGPRIHEFMHEMHQEVYAAHDGALLVVGEMPGVTVEEAALFTDPDREEVDMVFQFAHMSVDQGAVKWDRIPFSLPKLKGSLGQWQEGLGERGWNSLYWNNHDQPRVVSRFGDDEEFRVRSAKLLGTVLHLHRGTPYVFQGEELGMTNMAFETIEDFRDIESVNEYRTSVARGEDPAAVLDSLRFMSRDNART
ncbi:MAG: alpha-amylase family glycosyl hydrolase, partial [Actinomycetes bacterium]